MTPPVVVPYAGHWPFPWAWFQAEPAGSAMFRSLAVPSGAENVHLTDVHRFCGEAGAAVDMMWLRGIGAI